MDRYLKQLIDVLDKMKLEYELNEEKMRVELGFRTPNDRKVEVIIAVQTNIGAIKMFVPYLSQFPIEDAGKIFLLINKFNRKLIFGGLSVRAHKKEELILEFSQGISLDRGEEGHLFVGEIEDLISYIAFLLEKVVPDIKKEFEQMSKNE